MNDRLYEDLRTRAFDIAYRMLGSVADAEDIAHDALLRVHTVEATGENIASPLAFVATITTRLAIDRLRSARVRRETYMGTWLPEPIVTGADGDPAHHVELAESLSLAFLVLLESLTPEQRAALLLRDAFDYSYPDIAELIGTSEANARQLAARARMHVAERRPKFVVSDEQRTELAARFFAAARDGDLAGLEALLAQDVVLQGDGGGRVPALTRPVRGRSAVARTLVAWSKQSGAAGAVLEPVTVNGQPGALALDDQGRVFGVMALDIADGRVRGIDSIVNPDKLRHIGAVGDLRSVLKPRAQRTSVSSPQDRSRAI